MNRMTLCAAVLLATIFLTVCLEDGRDGIDGGTGPAGADAPIPSLD